MDVALYYPYINFRDPAWLKRAVLYWDRIERIEPAAHGAAARSWPTQARDQALLEHHDVIKSLMPNAGPLEALWMPFLGGHAEALRERYAVDPARRAGPQPLPADTNGYWGMATGDLASVWPAKMSESVLRAFVFEGLARKLGSGCIEMHPQLLSTYMTSLALEAVGARDVPAITDRPQHALLFGEGTPEAFHKALLNEPQVRDTPHADGNTDVAALMSLAVEAVEPAGLAQMSMEDVLELRERSLTTRRRFKDQFAKALADLCERRAMAADGTLTEQDMRYVARLYFEEPLHELRAQLHTSNGDAVTSVLTMSTALPMATVAGSLLTHTLVGMAVGATGIGVTLGAVGIAMGVVRAWRDTRKARQGARDKSPVAWLLDLEGHPTATSALAGFR